MPQFSKLSKSIKIIDKYYWFFEHLYLIVVFFIKINRKMRHRNKNTAFSDYLLFKAIGSL